MAGRARYSGSGFSAFFRIATKACEIILGQRYRVKYEKSMDEYVCDRSFVMEHALGWKKVRLHCRYAVLCSGRGLSGTE